MKRTGKVWTRIFPNIPVSKTNRSKNVKVKDLRILCVQVKPGRIIFEVDGVTEEVKDSSL